MELKDAVTLANQYGISTVLCMVVIGILVWVLKWVFDTSRRREDAMAALINTALVNLASNMGEITKGLNANTASLTLLQAELKETARYQREEHREILKKIDDSEREAGLARERLLNAIQDGCKAA